jgi:hypothetical protein
VRAENSLTADTHVPIAAPARRAVLGTVAHECTAGTTAPAARVATAALRPAVPDHSRRAAQEKCSPAEQACITAESDSEQAEKEEEEEEEEVEESPGARGTVKRRAAALAHELALRAAYMADMATRAVASAVAPGGNAQPRGTKRSAHAAGNDAETTGNAYAGQRDALARGAEESHGRGASSTGPVELTKPLNWDSMSKLAKHWRKTRAKQKETRDPLP